MQPGYPPGMVPSSEGKPQIFNNPQIQQLKAQIMAYRCLARTQPLAPGLAAAVLGRRPEVPAQGPSQSPQTPPVTRPGISQPVRPPHPQLAAQALPSSMPPPMNGPTMPSPREVPVPPAVVSWVVPIDTRH